MMFSIDEGGSGVLYMLILLVLVLMVIYLVRQIRDPLESISGPKPYPIIGNVYEMFQIEAVDLFLKWSQLYGKILKYRVFLLGTQVMISSNDYIKHVLVTNYLNYKKPETLLIPVRKIFGSRCVICLSHKDHAVRRKILNPAFNTSSLKDKAISITDNTYRLISLWKSASTEQVQNDLMRLSLDILGDCIFGYQFNCIENPSNELTAALYRVMSVQNMNFMRFLPFYKYLPTKMNKDIQLIRSFVLDIIKNKEGTAPGESSVDMLDLMLQSSKINNPDSSHGLLSKDDIIDDIILFIIAGHETVTNSLCWTLLQLARNPEIQEKCRKEVLDTAENNGHISYDDCSKLLYTECCIKEALRLHPPVPLTCRQAIKDDNLGGHFIPAGTVIALQLGAMMRSPDYFTDPGEYKPERFLSNSVKSQFLPFLAGPDMCIGSRFAMLEMKLMLAVLLLNVRFSLDGHDEFRGSQGLTYHVTPPLYLHITKIN